MLLTMKTCDSWSVSGKIMELPIKNLAFFVILDTHGVSYIYNDIVFVTCLLLRGESCGSRKLSSRHWSM